MGTEKLKIGELALKSGVTKRTIDYYTNMGLLEVERSASNYRYYSDEMIKRIHWIETLKSRGKSLEEIKSALSVDQSEEIDIQHIRLQMLLLEQSVTKLMDQTDEQERQRIRKVISPESFALMQSLLLLLP